MKNSVTLFITVIIPNYNHYEYLDTRIQSVLGQTYRDFEIIILDDCSTDNSRLVIEKYRKHERVSHIIYNETNSGSTFKQWEKGISLAKGDLIWIAESDDVSDCDFLEKMVREFQDERVVLAFCRSMQIDEKTEKIGIFPSQIKMNRSFKQPGIKFIKTYLWYRNKVVNASSALIRKKVIFNVKRDYYTYRGCGDWLFWIYISEQGSVSYLHTPLNLFRQHQSNTTKTLNKSGRNQKEVFQIYQYLVTHKYLSKLKILLFKVKNLEIFLSEDYFYKEDTRVEVFKTWHFSKVDFCLAYILKYCKKVVSYVR